MVVAKKTCKNNDDTYTGKEMSPLGLGYSPRAEKIGTVRMGRDKCTWIVINKDNVYVWSKAVNSDEFSKTISKEEPVMVENINCDMSETSSEASMSDIPKVKKTPKKKEDKPKDVDVDDNKEDKPEEYKLKEDKPKKAPPKKKLVPVHKPENDETVDKPTDDNKEKDTEDKPKKAPPKKKLVPKEEPEDKPNTDDNKEKQTEDKPKKKAPPKKKPVPKEEDDNKEKNTEDKEDKPKAVNKYIEFSKEVREQVKAEFPDLSPKDIVRKIAELWAIKKKEIEK